MPSRLATDAEITALAEDAKSISVGVRNFWRDFSGRKINTSLFGDVASDAHTLLTLHYLALSPQGKAVGLDQGRETTSEKVGNIGVSYSASSGSSGPHGSTSWGRAFDEVASAIYVPPEFY